MMMSSPIVPGPSEYRKGRVSLISRSNISYHKVNENPRVNCLAKGCPPSFRGWKEKAQGSKESSQQLCSPADHRGLCCCWGLHQWWRGVASSPPIGLTPLPSGEVGLGQWRPQGRDTQGTSAAGWSPSLPQGPEKQSHPVEIINSIRYTIC